MRAFRIKDLRDAAQVMGQQIHFFEVSSESDLDAAFAALVRRQTGGLLIVDDPLFSSHAARLVALTAQHAVPTIHYRREFVSAGGLLSYGSSLSHVYHQAGIYTGRILKMLWGGSGESISIAALTNPMEPRHDETQNQDCETISADVSTRWIWTRH